MSGLRVLVGCKRVIDYAVKVIFLPFCSLAVFYCTVVLYKLPRFFQSQFLFDFVHDSFCCFWSEQVMYPLLLTQTAHNTSNFDSRELRLEADS